MDSRPVLHFISGKLGSGKTTLAKKIAAEEGAIFISEDFWLEKLFPNEIKTFQNYLLYSRRFREIMGTHVVQLLKSNISVVLDFAGNIPNERLWVKSIFDEAKSEHILHYIVASDDLCKAQFKKRNRNLPEGSKIVTDEEFNAINQYFIPPEQNEGFNLKIHSPNNLSEAN